MGSLENGVLLKKDEQQNKHNNIINGRVASLSKQQRQRSRFPKRLGYLQWITTIVVFSLLVFIFQAFLPGSIEEKPGNLGNDLGLVEGDLMYLQNVIKILDFGKDLRFAPTKLLSKFKKDAAELNQSTLFGRRIRFGYRKPKLALVFADLAVDQYQILMVTLAAALQEIGYSIEIFANEDGPSHAVWLQMEIPVTLVELKDHCQTQNTVDWLNYDGILVNSLEGKAILSCLVQEAIQNVGCDFVVDRFSGSEIFLGIITHSMQACDIT
ncbi:hypothetical protein KSS87_006739 [Heliosperma pusillum]|nr:hypothetical protein KSS87_006739 [Heliosperma pusillum]